MIIVYWSSKSESTHRFVQKLNIENIRLPLNGTTDIEINQPFILIVPSYGDTIDTAIPKVVERFLSKSSNRRLMQGVIGAGNMDFGSKYCIAAKVVNFKYRVKLLYKFEISGTTLDVQNVQDIFNNHLRISNGSDS